MLVRAVRLRDELVRRRSVRQFSDRPVPREVIDACLQAAASAPSGANRQPWHFVLVTDPETRRRIRLEAEAEERAFYHDRAPDDWLEALAPLGTDEHKPFLEEAACLIVIFAQLHDVDAEGRKRKHYYVHESVGIATGMLITALHQIGLVSLTHTPSPMRFLNAILDRPPHERPFLILVAGHPAPGATVPAITRKPFDTGREPPMNRTDPTAPPAPPGCTIAVVHPQRARFTVAAVILALVTLATLPAGAPGAQ